MEASPPKPTVRSPPAIRPLLVPLKLFAAPAAARPLKIAPAPSVTEPVAASTAPIRSEEHTSELQSLMRISYAVFCLKKKKQKRASKKQNSNTNNRNRDRKHQPYIHQGINSLNQPSRT